MGRKSSAGRTLLENPKAAPVGPPPPASQMQLPHGSTPLSQSSTLVSEEVSVAGYLVDDTCLQTIDTAARRVLCPECPQSVTAKFAALPANIKTRLNLNSIAAIAEHFERSKTTIRSLTIGYTHEPGSSLDIVFASTGAIRISGCSDRPDFQFHVDQLKREILACSEEFHPVMRFLAYSRIPRKAAFLALLISSLFLLYNIVLFFYGSTYGVDVDPTILPNGNIYFKDVETAIGSDSTTEKLNVLLRGQFLHFANVSTVLQRCRTHLMWSLVTVVFSSGALFGLRYVRAIFPAAFFAFGPNIALREKLERKRDILVVGIVIAFVVNLVAGLVVAVIAS